MLNSVVITKRITVVNVTQEHSSIARCLKTAITQAYTCSTDCWPAFRLWYWAFWVAITAVTWQPHVTRDTLPHAIIRQYQNHFRRRDPLTELDTRTERYWHKCHVDCVIWFKPSSKSRSDLLESRVISHSTAFANQVRSDAYAERARTPRAVTSVPTLAVYLMVIY